MAADEGYLLGNREGAAGRRLRALSALFDPGTFRLVDELGIAAGTRCWEVGAGSRTVPDGLAARVGPTGLVVATDIDTTWLGAGVDQLRVVRHEVGVEPPPGEGFDLVHARLVLTHVPRRDRALADMAAALRPGGWLVLEEADPGLQPLLCPDEYGPAQVLANRLRHGFRELMAARGADLALGRRLPRLLRGQGLVDVAADARFPITGPACTVLEVATVEQIRGRLVDGGIATAADVDEHLANLAAGRVPDLATSPMVAAWGRRAPGPGDGAALDRAP